MLTEYDIRRKVRKQFGKRGDQGEFAERHGFPASTLSQELSGVRPVSDDLAATVGYRRVIRFIRSE